MNATGGIAVLMDIVLNHAYGQSPMVRMYWKRAARRPAEPTIRGSASPNQVFSFGYDFNHESVHTKKFIDREFVLVAGNARSWLSIRFHQRSPTHPAMAAAYDPARIAILKRMADVIWDFDKVTAVVILEHFAPNNEEKELAIQSGHAHLGQPELQL
ncbi:MAG: hypothetical protein R3C26_01580 [Calditrichia bacterium]